MTRDKAMRAARETHTVLDPGAVRVAAELVHRGAPLDVEPQRVPSRVQARDEPCADPDNCDVHPKPTPARVPDWVQDRAKWQAMSRTERRAVERHHRRVSGGRGSS